MLTVALALLGGTAQAEDYTLDPARSRLYVVVRNDPNTLAARLGHDHVISAESFTGKVTWDVENADACDVRITFPVSALQVDPGNLRAEASLDPDGAVSDGNKETIKENFSKKSQLWADSFPQITYQSTTCDGATGTVRVSGELTIRGVGKAITVPMKIEADGQQFRARGSFSLTHQDFGFKPFTNLAGALRNQDKLDFVVDVRGSASGS